MRGRPSRVTAPQTTRLLLVRHGESVTTVNQVMGGEDTCTGLSPLGVEQAEALRDRLASGSEPSIDALWSSTMPRAVETAQIIAPAVGNPPISTSSELVEHRPGEADGIKFAHFTDTFGSFDMRAEPHRPMAPGAESMAQFHHRAAKALHDLTTEFAGQTLLVSCHGGVIDAAFRSFLGLGLTASFDLWTRNTSITELGRSVNPAGKPLSVWTLHRYNDAAHLAGLPKKTKR